MLCIQWIGEELLGVWVAGSVHIKTDENIIMSTLVVMAGGASLAQESPS